MKEDLGLPRSVYGYLSYDVFGRQVPPERQLHRHDELEANFVVQGRATYLLNGRRYEMRPRDLLWLFPEQDHLLLEQDAGFGMWIMVWKPEAIRGVCTSAKNKTLLGGNPAGSFHRRLSDSSARKLNSLLENILLDDPDYLNAGLLHALVCAWHEFQQASSASPGEELHPSIERVARLLRDGNESGLEDLAHEVGLSPGHLSRLFKKQTGLTVPDFRNRQRLDIFFRLYGRGRQRTLSQAALAAGFGSYPQFHRVFKELTGQSPAEFAALQKSDLKN